MIIAFIYIFRFKKNCQNLENSKGFNEYNLFKRNNINNESIEFDKLLQK